MEQAGRSVPPDMDSDNLSSGRLRVSWCKLLEDLGYQYDFISYLDVKEGRIDLSKRFKVIILPQVICLSESEVSALSDFVRSGGMLIADAICGLLTETGRGRAEGALDDLFGIRRDESRGYLDGRGITEIDAEYSKQAFSRATARIQQCVTLPIHGRIRAGHAGGIRILDRSFQHDRCSRSEENRKRAESILESDAARL